MQIRSPNSSDIEPVRLFLFANGWGHRVGDASHFSELMRNTQCAAVAMQDEAVVGFARGLTDGVSNGYLSMVAVATHCRLQGVGSALVRHVLGDDPDITWVLRAGREGAPEFFRKLGFSDSTVAMERRRRVAADPQ